MDTPTRPGPTLSEVASDWLRILTFRAGPEDLAALGPRHLAAGLAATVLVGAGRYWDNPKALLLQHLGLGSLAYILVLACVLFIAVKPLSPGGAFSFRNLLTWLSLCSLPAAFYALPVERWMPVPAARSLNIAFLAVVATWRVALLVAYLRRFALLSWFRVAVATLLPLTAIVTALAVLNVEHAVFDIMSGIDESDARGGAYLTVLILAVGSIYVFPVALLAWIWIGIREAVSRQGRIATNSADRK
jgi:hypothetical protein